METSLLNFLYLIHLKKIMKNLLNLWIGKENIIMIILILTGLNAFLDYDHKFKQRLSLVQKRDAF